jgi:hypothetical protein
MKSMREVFGFAIAIVSNSAFERQCFSILDRTNVIQYLLNIVFLGSKID